MVVLVVEAVVFLSAGVHAVTRLLPELADEAPAAV
jgi:hypothetical protein